MMALRNEVPSRMRYLFQGSHLVDIDVDVDPDVDDDFAPALTSVEVIALPSESRFISTSVSISRWIKANPSSSSPILRPSTLPVLLSLAPASALAGPPRPDPTTNPHTPTPTRNVHPHTMTIRAEKYVHGRSSSQKKRVPSTMVAVVVIIGVAGVEVRVCER